jgi:hypothetical protein
LPQLRYGRPLGPSSLEEWLKACPAGEHDGHG